MPGIGDTLRATRESKGLTLEDVQRELHIRERYLQALEHDDFDIIPGDVYARGFLRSYARYLGVAPEPLLAQMPVPVAKEPEEPAVVPAEPPHRRPKASVGGRQGSQWPWVVLPLIFLVALLYFVGSHPGLFGGAAPRPSAAASGPPPHKTHHKTHHKVHHGNPSGGVVLQSAPPSQGPYGGPEANYTVAKGPITVRITLSGPCYLYVLVDGATQPVSATVQPSGSFTYTAQQSIVLKVGNPPAAEVTVDGQAVPINGQNAQSIGVSVGTGG